MSWYVALCFISYQVITPKNEGCQAIPDEGGEIVIEYNVPTSEQIQDLLDRSSYCHQELFYNCTNADLKLDEGYGYYSLSGDYVEYWGGNTGDFLSNIVYILRKMYQ